MKASERSAMSALRWCIVSTTVVSPTVEPDTSRGMSARGMMPFTSPPAAAHADATLPMRPTLPPP